MIDPIGLCFGLLALGGLITQGIKIVNHVKHSKRLDEHLDLLLTQLEIEMTRLMLWGQERGLLSQQHNRNESTSDLENSKPVIQKALRSIYSLLRETERLLSKYSTQNALPNDSSNHQDTTLHPARSCNTMQPPHLNRVLTSQKFSESRIWNFAKKIRWAVHDHRKLTSLIMTLRVCVDGLWNMTLVTSPHVLPSPSKKQIIIERREDTWMSGVALKVTVMNDRELQLTLSSVDLYPAQFAHAS